MNKYIENPYSSQFWTRNYDKGVPSAVDVPEMNVYELLEKTAKYYGKRPAIYFLKKRMTYKKLKEYVDKLATALFNLGVKKGDVLGLLMSNAPQYIVAYYGILRAGGIVCPFNTSCFENELEHQLCDSGAEILFADSVQLDKINNIKDSTSLHHVIISNAYDFTPKGNKNPPEIKGTMQLLNLINNAKPSPPTFETKAHEDIAVLQYTGGTTGLPKGAMLTHYALINGAKIYEQWTRDYMTRGKETVLTQLPLYYMLVSTICINTFVNIGGCIALYSDLRDQDSFLEVFKKSHPTHLLGVPRTYIMLLENEEFKILARRFKTIKICESGAAPLPPETIQEFEDITGAKIIEYYGMTESGSVIASNPVNGERKRASIGMPLPNIEFKLVEVEDYGKVVPLGEVGEIMVKEDSLLKGYWNEPELTAKRVKEGWFLTGDIARMDDEGYIYIVDRKDLPEPLHRFVYPKNIEEALLKHDAVDEAKVVGVSDPDNPESHFIKAIILLKEGFEESDNLVDEIRDFCEKHLESFEIPKLFELKKD
ncbi:MAG: AMP-binding protein [Candidatus Lokiarchaeota archaeon]|nr:AMP-binding protein [Candidatus Lokiarchaeota archaeon]